MKKITIGVIGLLIIIGMIIGGNTKQQYDMKVSVAQEYNDWTEWALKTQHKIIEGKEKKDLDIYNANINTARTSLKDYNKLPDIDQTNDKLLFPWIEPLTRPNAIKTKKELENLIDESPPILEELERLEPGKKWAENIRTIRTKMNLKVSAKNIGGLYGLFRKDLDLALKEYENFSNEIKSLKEVEEGYYIAQELIENKEEMVNKIKENKEKAEKQKNTVKGIYMDNSNWDISKSYDDTYIVEFTIENVGDEKISYVEFDLRGYDSKGNVINTDWTNWSGNLRPNDKAIVETYFDSPGLSKYSISVSKVHN